MTDDLETVLAAVRPALLRHCYRLVGRIDEAEDLVQVTLERAWKARATFRGDAPIDRWLFTIATNACLNALERRRHLTMPQLEVAPSGADFTLVEAEPSSFISPALDATLFPGVDEGLERRERVALAFIALLQRVPPRQRAAVLMKDVLGWSAEEIADALELTVASVNSALHRGRQTLATVELRDEEPAPQTLGRFLEAWQTHDLDALVALLRHDVELAMPPWAMWFRGVEAVRAFFTSPRFEHFWAGGVRLEPSRANGSPAFVFLRAGAFHSLMVVRFVGEAVASMNVFVGETAQFRVPRLS